MHDVLKYLKNGSNLEPTQLVSPKLVVGPKMTTFELQTQGGC
jgi:hypothetical protein